MFLHRYWLVLLILFVTVSRPAAQSDDAQTAKLKWAYGEYVKMFEADFEPTVRELNETARTRRTFDSNTDSMSRRFIQSLDYQKIIDQMVCVETELAKLKDCSAGRRQTTIEMWKFQMEYGDRMKGGLDLKCEMKSRLLKMEFKYPPAAYMMAGRDEFDRPKAVDAKTYMECVKENI